MDIEAWSSHNPIKKESWSTVLTLAYQSLGVVYGDLSTSPLYVYKTTFEEDIEHSETNEEIFGVLSFIFWTLTLIPLLKYVFIVLRADDNGEGGTFALYSLLCRHAKVSGLPNSQQADQNLYEYKKDGVALINDKGLGMYLKKILEKHKFLQQILLILALIGTCTVIGDGVLTPAISVFSAVSGLELSMSKQQHQYLEVPVACAILVFLFYLQHYGTHRIGFLFAPIVIAWLLCISAIGLYNIIYWNPHVYQALSPYYMYKFLKKTRRSGWMSLGGILLCITGSEAMFADLGHFSQLSIKIAFTFVVYPSLILAYMGQAAYLSKHHIIESDYRIGFYASVPEKLHWPVLIIAILAAVVGSQAIITGTFSIIKQCSALGCFPNVRVKHTSSKIHGQIYIPEVNWTLMLLCLAVTIGFRDTKHISNASVPHVRPEERFLVGRVGPKDYRIYRCITRYGYRDVHMDDVEFERELVCSIAEFILSEAPEITDNHEDQENDEIMTIIGGQTSYFNDMSMASQVESTLSLREVDSPHITSRRVTFLDPESPNVKPNVREELQDLMEAREAGMAFILGHCYVKAKSGSSLIKKLAIDIGYDFLRRNCRGPTYALSFPQASTLEVGMIYRV